MIEIRAGFVVVVVVAHKKVKLDHGVDAFRSAAVFTYEHILVAITVGWEY